MRIKENSKVFFDTYSKRAKISVIMKAPHTLFRKKVYEGRNKLDVMISYDNNKTFSSRTKTFKTGLNNV